MTIQVTPELAAALTKKKADWDIERLSQPKHKEASRQASNMSAGNTLVCGPCMENEKTRKTAARGPFRAVGKGLGGETVYEHVGCGSRP